MSKYKMCPLIKDFCMGSKCAMWVESASRAIDGFSDFGNCAFTSIAQHMPDSNDVSPISFADPAEEDE